MKKFALFGLGLISCIGIGLGISQKPVVNVRAEDESSETISQSTVVISSTNHGTITTDITEGQIGDICTVTAQADLLYVVKTVKVNGVDLIEDEETTGKFVFSLVEAENVITATFVVDEELCGVFSDMISEVENKDWTNLFSVKNILTIVSWVLDGGLLIAMVRYFVKDKKLAKTIEDKVEETVKSIIPDTTKEIIMSNFESVITPMVTQLQADNAEMKKAMSTFAKCMALAQQDTPEARNAIIEALSNLDLGNEDVLKSVKEYIANLFAQHEQAYKETMEQIAAISKSNQKIIDDSTASTDTHDDGTQI